MEKEKEMHEGKEGGQNVNQKNTKESENAQEATEGKRQKGKEIQNTSYGKSKETEEAHNNGIGMADMEIEPIIDNLDNMVYEKNNRIPIGRIIGGFFETIWTCIKLFVVVGITVIVVGFFLSRNLLVRGRNGERQCLSTEMSSKIQANKSAENEKVKEWLKTTRREKITLEADDEIILVARKMVVDSESDKWAIILHGYNGDMSDVYDIAMHYTEKGYNILTPDLRANGESEGSFFGMGWLDRLDVVKWMDVILEENPSAQIVIHGVDMGADAALMLSGEQVKSSIKAIVAEGAYTNAWEVTKKEYETRYSKLPVFPIMNMMTPVMKVWAGYSLKEADAVKQVKKTSIPILLISGKNDIYASQDMTKELDQAIASQHEVMTVESGSHGDCRYAEPEKYYNQTFEFVGGYIN